MPRPRPLVPEHMLFTRDEFILMTAFGLSPMDGKLDHMVIKKSPPSGAVLSVSSYSRRPRLRLFLHIAHRKNPAGNGVVFEASRMLEEMRCLLV